MLTNITDHPTGEGKLYLCAVKYACSKRIVDYSINATMASQLAVDALRNALTLRGRLDPDRSCGLTRPTNRVNRKLAVPGVGIP